MSIDHNTCSWTEQGMPFYTLCLASEIFLFSNQVFQRTPIIPYFPHYVHTLCSLATFLEPVSLSQTHTVSLEIHNCTSLVAVLRQAEAEVDGRFAHQLVDEDQFRRVGVKAGW